MQKQVRYVRRVSLQFKLLLISLMFLLVACVFSIEIHKQQLEIKKELHFLEERLESIRVQHSKTIDLVKETKNLVFKHRQEQEKYRVRLTSYWTNDSTNSGRCTSSGLCTKDFGINDRGWYTYQDKLVIASATYKCLYASSGSCGKYDSLPEGYKIHDLYEEITLNIDGEEYQGIVLDSCGASFWEEELQRYDLFVTSKDSAIDIKGVEVYKNE